MHELSLAQAVINEVLRLSAEHGAKKILRVNVMIGAFSGIVQDSFRFCFNTLASTHKFTTGAILEIETPPVIYQCTRCGHGFKVKSSHAGSCPVCGGDELFPHGGDELLLMQIEMEYGGGPCASFVDVLTER